MPVHHLLERMSISVKTRPVKTGSDAILVQSWYLRYFCGNR
jgi:hypothetical protein